MTILSNKTISGKLAKSTVIKTICMFWVFFRKKFKITKLIENLVICILLSHWSFFQTYLTLISQNKKQKKRKNQKRQVKNVDFSLLTSIVIEA